MFCYIRQTTAKLTLLRLHLIVLCAQKVTGIITISPSLPEVNTRATLSCYSVEVSRAWHHNGLPKASCNNQKCLPDADPQSGYTFTADNDKAQVTISSLDRTRDGGLWMCTSSKASQNITLDVYSFPSGLYITQGEGTGFDLAEFQTILQCQTDGCMYPVPTIRWYFKDIAPSALLTFYKDTGTQVTGGSCTSPEELYTSRLVLPRYTIWQDNIDKNVTLSCGIEYSNVSRNVYSQESKQIRYAVRVTEAVIQHNNHNITDILIVTAGVPIILTCLTGISRPPATIVWFLGSQSKGSGANWNYTPSPADHNGIFYCQVYNTDQNQKIDSNKARLYVKVGVDSVHLRNGTALTLNEGQLAVLICETGASRPSAAIYWMKNGANITDSPSAVTITNQANDLFISVGTLHYIGKREDNGKSLACGAFNGLDSGPTSTILTVTIYYPTWSPPEIEGRVNGSSFTVIEHTSQSLACRIIGGNPLANLSWICLGLIGISNISERTVVSEIVLALDRSVQDQRCTCRALHPHTKTDVFVLLQVHYPPNIHLQTSPYKLIENQTLNVTCQVNSKPPADQISWSPSGDGSVSSILYISSVSRNNKGNYSCTAKNTMTPTVGGQQIGISIRQMEVDVLYPPSIQVMTNPYVVIENQTLDVNCLASGNPPPDNISWTPSGEGSVPSRLYFSSVSRDKSGTYICTAQNTMIPTTGGKQTGMSTRQIKVDVQFAPEMSVKVTPSIAEVNSEVRIECSVHGEPSSYKFYDWIHKLGNNEVRHIKGILVNQSTLGISFPSITIADMGTYICSVDNGITGPNGGLVQSMESQINLIGVPVAFVSDTVFIGEPDMSVSIRIPFFSNPSITDLKFFKTWNNDPIANDTNTQVYYTEANISTVFHNTDVVLQGMEAVLHFRSLKESDFGQYTLVLYNNKGTATLILHLKALEPHTDANIGPSIAGIAGGIGGGVVVIVVTGVVIFLWRKHSHTNNGADGTACVPTAENYEALQAKNNEGSLYQELSDIKSCADTENSFRRNGTKTTENQSTYLNTKETVCIPQDQENF